MPVMHNKINYYSFFRKINNKLQKLKIKGDFITIPISKKRKAKLPFSRKA